MSCLLTAAVIPVSSEGKHKGGERRQTINLVGKERRLKVQARQMQRKQLELKEISNINEKPCALY